jgi:hypothetical protein
VPVIGTLLKQSGFPNALTLFFSAGKLEKNSKV